jgi:hypothetical protein
LKSQNNIKNKKCEVIDVLKKFNHNRIYTEHRNSKLKAIVGKVNFNHTFKLMKYSLYQINNLSDQIKQTYLKNTRLLHNKIIYIFAFDPFITNLCRVKKIR